MARRCDICGKGTAFGHNVSHAKNRTNRVWKPNLVQVKTMIDGTVLTTEDKDSAAAQTYANIIAVLPGNEDDPRVVALISALQSEKIRAFINETYGISVVPMF